MVHSMTRNSTVLLVEKDEDDFRFFSAALREGASGRRVHWAHDAEDARAYLAGVEGYSDRTIFPPPDLILVDLRRPGVGELEFVRWLRGGAEGAHIPVVALSAAHDPGDWTRAKALGVDAFHLRPAEPRRLAALVDSLVRFWSRHAQNVSAMDSHAA